MKKRENMSFKSSMGKKESMNYKKIIHKMMKMNLSQMMGMIKFPKQFLLMRTLSVTQ